MTKPEDKIHRRVFTLWAQQYDALAKHNNTWKYFRAPEGKKFLLHSIELSTAGLNRDESDGVFCLFDGHEYTQWDIFPGVINHEVLTRFETNSVTAPTHYSPLNNWECKEVTLASRSSHTDQIFRIMVILWYYLVDMSKEETYEYGAKQPRYSFRRGGPTTLDPKNE